MQLHILLFFALLGRAAAQGCAYDDCSTEYAKALCPEMCATTAAPTEPAPVCISSNTQRFCCDSGPVGECPGVDCTCDPQLTAPEPFYCTMFGCDSVYAEVCPSCYVPPTTTVAMTTAAPPPPPLPYYCSIGIVFCAIPVCCDATECSGTPTCAVPTTAPLTTVPTTPVVTTPVETTPVETTPVETTPVETTPVETTPVETTPVETTPVETTPIETTVTTPIETTTAELTTTVPPMVCEYTNYLPSMRMIGGSLVSACADAPGFIYLGIAPPPPLTNPIPLCSGILLDTETIKTSEFCAGQLALLPSPPTVITVYNALDAEIGTLADLQSSNAGEMKLSTPVVFDAATCILPACLPDDTVETDPLNCVFTGAGVASVDGSQVVGPQSAAISLTGTCSGSSNICVDPATTVESCTGDPGAPVMCPDQSGQMIVEGLAFEGPDAQTVPCYSPVEFISLR